MYKGGDLSTKGRDLSTEGEIHQLRGRLVYGGGGSSTEGETRLQRARLFCGGTDSYAEGETIVEGETRLRSLEWPEHCMCRIYVYHESSLIFYFILHINIHNVVLSALSSSFIYHMPPLSIQYEMMKIVRYFPHRNQSWNF